MNYILLDTEFNQYKNIQEIIQLSAIKLVLEDNIIRTDSFFNKYIRPKKGKILTPYIKKKTKILQSDIDKAQNFDETIYDFRNWIGEEYILLGWSMADKKELIRNSELHKLSHKWVQKYINLQAHYTSMIKDKLEIEEHLKPLICFKSEFGLATTIQYEKMEFSGQPHNALSDSINMTKIFYKHLNEWTFMSKKTHTSLHKIKDD